MSSLLFYISTILTGLILTAFTVQSSLSPNTDLNALLKLKSSMLPTSPTVLSNWKPSTSHCLFTGVVCNGESRVVSLNVSFVKLEGTMGEEIGELDELVNLTLSYSNLSGIVPVEIGKLRSLKVLNISNNRFSGEFGKEVGLVLGKLSQLEVVDLYNNNFTGTLPAELVNLKKLRHLHLGGNFFSGSIPESYSEITSLVYLGLNGNSHTGKIPPSLGRLYNLQELYLGYFNMYEGGIPGEFGDLRSLKRLDLGSCNLSGEIPMSLGKLTELDSLFLQFNNFMGSIPEELSSLGKLKSLDMSNNYLTGEIPVGFAKLEQLTLLHLFRNHLFGPIPEFIAELPFLEVLQLWENNFTLGLPEKLGSTGSLRRLDLTSNHLTGVIPKGLCAGRKLETLILMDNFFIGPIPEELGECKSLTRVRLAKNFLNGSIPAGIFNLPLVDFLELNDNYFTGKLPEKMSGDVLELLVLANNQLTGKIPVGVGNFTNLQTLSFELNSLSGQIPAEIGDLKFLSKVNFSHNSISGEIPVALSNCSHLTLLDLSGNNLSGAIPKQIARLKVLNILNLSSNQLVGQVPKSVGAMKLSVLDLSYNNLSGPIQFTVFNETSFVGNPNLCGPLMRTLCEPSKNQQLENKSLVKVLFIVILSPIAAILVSLFLFLKIKECLKRNQNSKAWRLAAFQRLEFTVEDVLKCLKEENMIGQGGAGTVYHGSMPDGSDVAIKQLTGRSSGKSDNGFSAEIQTLGKIRHRNIVRLLGYVSNKDSNLLLYEYMPNGSLGELLRGSKGSHFGWNMRYRVAVEAAKGLCYLHHDCSPLIIHRDVKSNNILLDSDFEAHVADFGLAKFLTDAGASEGMSSIAGSYGYIAPEYAYTLRVDEKSDVYSFGVVLLELITGKKPIGEVEFGDGVDIVRWIQTTISGASEPSCAQSVLLVADSRLTEENLSAVVNLFKVAMLCVEESSDTRPTMREVVHMLTNPPQSFCKVLAL